MSLLKGDNDGSYAPDAEANTGSDEARNAPQDAVAATDEATVESVEQGWGDQHGDSYDYQQTDYEQEYVRQIEEYKAYSEQLNESIAQRDVYIENQQKQIDILIAKQNREFKTKTASEIKLEKQIRILKAKERSWKREKEELQRENNLLASQLKNLEVEVVNFMRAQGIDEQDYTEEEASEDSYSGNDESWHASGSVGQSHVFSEYVTPVDEETNPGLSDDHCVICSSVIGECVHTMATDAMTGRDMNSHKDYVEGEPIDVPSEHFEQSIVLPGKKKSSETNPDETGITPSRESGGSIPVHYAHDQKPDGHGNTMGIMPTEGRAKENSGIVDGRAADDPQTLKSVNSSHAEKLAAENRRHYTPVKNFTKSDMDSGSDAEIGAWMKEDNYAKQTEDKTDNCEKNGWGSISPPPPLSEKPPTSPVQIHKKFSKIGRGRGKKSGGGGSETESKVAKKYKVPSPEPPSGLPRPKKVVLKRIQHLRKLARNQGRTKGPLV
jgi:hypothetical protein